MLNTDLSLTRTLILPASHYFHRTFTSPLNILKKGTEKYFSLYKNKSWKILNCYKLAAIIHILDTFLTLIDQEPPCSNFSIYIYPLSHPLILYQDFNLFTKSINHMCIPTLELICPLLKMKRHK